ncbi:MAG: succinylglutamate desuccinylase/aspartoacylase family protein [Verrucomicrobiota bacterium]
MPLLLNRLGHKDSRATTRRSLENILAPLEQLAVHSVNLIAEQGTKFESAGQTYELPRYRFIGPRGGGDPIRIGLFAGIHGDETEGIHALIQFIKLIDAKPELATDYCLFLYPVCNPTGLTDNTRLSRSGKDLNREFWQQSAEPEVKILEAELTTHTFQGLISLHTDDTSDGFYGYAHGATLTQYLIEPALQAADQFVPRNGNRVIDGFNARNGIIRDGFKGILRAPPNARPRPFELILETPKYPPEFLKESALVTALLSILSEYRKLVAFAPNL